MSRIVVHAPDGGWIPGSLCQEPTGDLSIYEADVTCLDCLDVLEESNQTFGDLAKPAQEVWNLEPRRAQAVR
ncbi:Uncharacterised protein [Mycobacteroides abscessus subsp. abscessus]|nr:Uncharacterised protein [Mycobacteroides abscessus subsp. abscessus]SIC79860.1 Uncharacterised protein [Mycobacteroides abscessus subsp. abscessus]SKK32744.1 Uncharacterised protein [Mycobacteroides abscessus subsp. abscessus]SKP26398.1 Uncharacterised protein [Mycobacteroides abscessus subsp. abscessus]